MKRLLLLGAFLIAAWASTLAGTPHAQGCAFSITPDAYEAVQNRGAYLVGLELAGYNQIESNDGYFGTPVVEIGTREDRGIADDPYIPPTLLKAIGWIESALAQAANSVPWGAVGPALISFDCGHGIMQITSGMTSPNGGGGEPSVDQALVATHYLYNIARGAAILAEKWNAAPQVRPIAGTDTDSDPEIVENWYFAVWSYNGFTGPFAAGRANHPLSPDYAVSRSGFSCGPAGDGYGHNYGNYPYQEIVFGCAARPPSVQGEQLWNPINLSLPDLSDSRWAGPLAIGNFTSSDGFARMDMPSPRPYHLDPTGAPGSDVAAFLRGSPALAVSRTQVHGAVNSITISNRGSGILAWQAKAGQSWISLNKQAGVALSADVPCSGACERSARLTITIGSPEQIGWVDIESLTTGEVWRVLVLSGLYDVNCDGATNTIDALLVLQFSAGFITQLPCADRGDVNNDGRIDPIDAAIILQFIAASA